MPSLQHEFVVDLFRQNPQLLLSLIHDSLGIVPPPHTQVQVCEADLTELLPVEARAQAAPELAMMSLLAHADEPVVAEVARAALAALKLYSQVIVMVLEHACRKGLLERLVMEALIEKYGDRLKVEMFEIGRNLGEARGEAKGKAEAILMLLRKRGMAADEAAAARILGGGDLGVLDRWFDRAITALSVQDLFRE